jgi:UrcA family protein
MRRCSTLALVAGALGAAFAATSANAQDYASYGPPQYQNAPPESVIVEAPRFRADTSKLNGPWEKVSLSNAVTYADLDLRTRDGAHELHRRVWEAAQNVCAQLADAYPVYEMNGTSCLKTAYENGTVRANAAITSVRVAYRQGEY